MEDGKRPQQSEFTRRAIIFGVPTVAANIYFRRYEPVREIQNAAITAAGNLAIDGIRAALKSIGTPHVSTEPTTAPKQTPTNKAPTIETSGEKIVINVLPYPWNDRVPPVAKENWQAKYITMHFTVGPAEPNRKDLTSYHYVFGKDGRTHACQSTVQHQAPPPGYTDIVDWQMYAAHTANANTRNIGLSLCGAMNAIGDPNKGGVPVFSPASLDSMLKMAAFQAKTNNIPLDKDHIKTHYQWAQYFEQKGMKTENDGKTDITRIPWMKELDTPEKVHDYLLKKIVEYTKRPIQVNNP